MLGLGKAEVDDVEEAEAPVDVAEEREAETLVSMRAAYQARDIGHQELYMVRVFDGAHKRIQCGEGIGCYLKRVSYRSNHYIKYGRDWLELLYIDLARVNQEESSSGLYFMVV